jgi:hypothetical protein
MVRPRRIGVAEGRSPATPISASPLSVGELAGHLAVRIAIGDVAATVVGLLAAGETDLDLGSALAGEVQAKRDERQALRLRPAEQLVDLGAAEEQLANPLGLVVVAIGLFERRDMGADQPRLVAFDARVGIGQVDLAGADRLDLGAGQDEAGLERLLDRELIPRPPIQGDGFLGNVRTPWMDRSIGVPDGTVRIACTTPTPNAETPVLCGPALPSYPTHRVSD